MKKKTRLIWALICIFIALGTMLLTIVRHGANRYHLWDIVNGSFEQEVYKHYNGPIVINVTTAMMSVMIALYIVFFILATIGILVMRKQLPSKLIFGLMIMGMIGMALPSIFAIIIITISNPYYEELLSPGLACILPVLAMLACILLVTKEYRVQKALFKKVRKAGLLNEAGDL